MQRFSLLLATLFCAAIPAAHAGGTATGDGSLSVSGVTPVSGANGSVTLAGKGVVYGYLAAGTITVFSYKPDANNAVPTVSGAKMKLSNNASNVTYTGSNVRFVFPGGRYRIEIDGNGLDLSAIGNGSVSASGNGSLTADNVLLAIGRAPAYATWGSTAIAATPVGKNG
jgi:hypothetical protein